ncbi:MULTISPECIES: ComEC/Rec2 family competence protein [Sulfurimonas]|uniref:ComEC/Rec2 family competence protein n=1 Tax=Sulfurimonas TaxID=202746 RepID=UPI001264384B|nr:ComEC/Rec2 family competence protein [Sulfurimonas indica]
MASLERVELLSSRKDYLYLLTLFILLFTTSLSYEYYKYKQLTKFDSQLVDATILKQYTKTKVTKKGKTKTYQVLKIKSFDGFTFYSTASKNLPNYKDKNILLEVWAGKITFLEYLKGFFAFSKILEIDTKSSIKENITTAITQAHAENDASAIYQALYLAKSLPYHLQQTFSNLGISHLIAISGFHLGVLSALLYFLIKYPYRLLQNRYFPYRSAQRDTFFIITFVLLTYMLFLDVPPSLLRAFAMLCTGFILYEKGIKIISLQTLLLTCLLLIAFFPRLLFSIGFALSLSGVFYIFLFLIYFQQRNKLWQFLLLPFWVYLMMLPYSLVIFGNFSLYHPLSILWTSLFTLFYPLSIFLHLIGFGDLLDSLLISLLQLNPHAVKIAVPNIVLYGEIFLSLLAVFKKEALYLLLFYCLCVFIYSIYHIT